MCNFSPSSSPCSTEALWSFCRSSLQIPESLFPEGLLPSPQRVSLAPLAIALSSRAGSFSSASACHATCQPRSCQQQWEPSERQAVMPPCQGKRLWTGGFGVKEDCWGAGDGQVLTWVSHNPPWACSLAPWFRDPSLCGAGTSRRLSRPVWGVVVLSWQRQALLNDEVALASQTGVLL